MGFDCVSRIGDIPGMGTEYDTRSPGNQGCRANATSQRYRTISGKCDECPCEWYGTLSEMLGYYLMHPQKSNRGIVHIPMYNNKSAIISNHQHNDKKTWEIDPVKKKTNK